MMQADPVTKGICSLVRYIARETRTRAGSQNGWPCRRRFIQSTSAQLGPKSKGSRVTPRKEPPPPSAAAQRIDLFSLHPQVTVPRRTPSDQDLAMAAYFFQSPVRFIHSAKNFSPEFEPPPGVRDKYNRKDGGGGPNLGLAPEVAFLGASSSGKSSLLNVICNRLNAKIARASSKPGSTKIVNFYNIKDRLMLVDLMGYGVGSRRDWGGTIEDYLAHRVELKRVFWLLRAQEPELHPFDAAVLDLLLRLRVPFVPVLTQVDQVACTAALLRKVDQVQRLVVDRAPAQVPVPPGVVLASIHKFEPPWDVRLLGSDVLANAIDRDMGAAAPGAQPQLQQGACSTVDAGAGGPSLRALGLITATSEQWRRAGKSNNWRLNKPGVAQIQHQIMKDTSQNMSRWMARYKANVLKFKVTQGSYGQ